MVDSLTIANWVNVERNKEFNRMLKDLYFWSSFYLNRKRKEEFPVVPTGAGSSVFIWITCYEIKTKFKFLKFQISWSKDLFLIVFPMEVFLNFY